MKPTTEACGCCEGIEIVTPEPTANRPGLSALSYRIGTHAAFLETMLARLSSSDYPKLAELRTRETNDPAIAFLDAWAVVADVLTFYNERIINEGYLRTATERRSILELARLVGYKLRPGVASSVYLAYTLDDNFKEEAIISKGAKSQSIPGPNELPQAFETSEELKARAQWNNLRPRMNRPQTIFSMLLDPKGPRIYVKGINTNLKPNDPLLIDFDDEKGPRFTRVKEVIADPLTDRSLILLQIKSEQSKISSNDGFLEMLRDQKGIEIILLDRGDGLPGFFGFDHVSDHVSDKAITLFSFHDNNRWSMEIVSSEGEPILIKLNSNGKESHYRIEAAELIENDFISYFRITLQSVQSYSDLLTTLGLPPSVQPRNELRLEKDLKGQFTGSTTVKTEPSINTRLFSTSTERFFPAMLQQDKKTNILGLDVVAEGSNALIKRIAPLVGENLASANANANVTNLNPIKVYALRIKASMFGNNVPETPVYGRTNDDTGMITIDHYTSPVPLDIWAPPLSEQEWLDSVKEGMATIFTDSQLDQILNDSWLVIDRPEDSERPSESSGRSVTIHKVQNNQIVTKSAQGVPSKVSLLTIHEPWLSDEKPEVIKDLLASSTALLRETSLYAQSEELILADEPINNPICGDSDDLIELDGYYEDLQAGRWAVVSGERADTAGTQGVKSSELAMISVVRQDVSRQPLAGKEVEGYRLPGDKMHTFIKLAEPLQYCFKRDTVIINGNVVKATHGDTRKETLGSGDGAKALQAFVLKQPPLTYVSASNPSGVDSTLKIFVNDVQWHETDALTGLSPTDRNFITKTDDDGKTTVVFGNGKEGSRLPTGIENIKAEYRNGIGKPGNVKASQISLLTTRPLGVKEVVNPLSASGGADKESRDQARKNAPLAIKALDRLVSVHDYEDFARVYAGIGKARAAELSNGRRQLVHVTIAGSDDIPLDKNSDLYRNLRQSLLDFGDPFQPLQLEIRELMFIVIQANIRILPDYLWEPVVTQVRAALLDAFSFERRELGQDVPLSEVLGVMQSVRGVAYVDVDAFGGIPEKQFIAGRGRQLLTPAEIAERVQKFVDSQQNRPDARLNINLADFEPGENDMIHPAQLAFLSPEVPETLILNQIN
jgi:predicted phage baseplate assembly protein